MHSLSIEEKENVFDTLAIFDNICRNVSFSMNEKQTYRVVTLLRKEPRQSKVTLTVSGLCFDEYCCMVC